MKHRPINERPGAWQYLTGAVVLGILFVVVLARQKTRKEQKEKAS